MLSSLCSLSFQCHFTAHPLSRIMPCPRTVSCYMVRVSSPMLSDYDIVFLRPNYPVHLCVHGYRSRTSHNQLSQTGDSTSGNYRFSSVTGVVVGATTRTSKPRPLSPCRSWSSVCYCTETKPASDVGIGAQKSLVKAVSSIAGLQEGSRLNKCLREEGRLLSVLIISHYLMMKSLYGNQQRSRPLKQAVVVRNPPNTLYVNR